MRPAPACRRRVVARPAPLPTATRIDLSPAFFGERKKMKKHMEK